MRIFIFQLLLLFSCLNGQNTIGVSSADGAGAQTNTIAWDSTTGNVTSTVDGVVATATFPRVSQATPLQNGVLDTRVGAIGTAATNIFAAWNHQHPLVAMAIPVLPPFAAAGQGGAVVSTGITRQRATEESVEYYVQVRTSNTGTAQWMTLTAPTITGFYLTEMECTVYDATVGNTAPYYGQHPSFNWAGQTTYIRPLNTNQKIWNCSLTYYLN